ncbi:MAG: riboflavin synthase [Lewinellaceae bacterium]|nr:riboflavin synthase [Saprospiraceae bacterium]MCB9313147.1 riboflavin synthase [Lewinellaceae bacterium]HRW76750.1 riboflavin synthase [Saprospiraceae bacterium]
MFTGIVECLGRIEAVEREGTNVHLWVSSPISDELKVDQSVAHDGVCLTVTALQPGRHAVTLVAESLQRSHFREIKAGRPVNIERAVSLQHRLDGHLVQGHVDGVMTCIGREDRDGSWWFTFRFDPASAHLLIDKGSICINGVSLTVIQPTRETFSVTIIPYTIDHTTFGSLMPGDLCNVEFDLVAKYLARWRELDN